MVTDMEHRDQKQSNHRLLQRAEEFVRRENMLPPGGGLVLCAVSGGLDSVTLLHFLHRLAEEENFRLTVAHFNHRLRGEASEADARFVEQLCAQWSIPCVAGDGDVAAYAQEHGMGIEEAARHCRYAFLEEAAAALGAERIATAHQAEDNAETVLLQLIRGSGSEGLGGIAPVRDKLIRPFLTVSREEIEAYAKNSYVTGVYSYPQDKVVEGCKATFIRTGGVFDPYALLEIAEDDVGGSLPMVKIDSKQELATCIDACVPTPDESYHSRWVLNQMAAGYDDAFFAEKTLFFLSAVDGNGAAQFSFVHALSDASFTIVIDQSTPRMSLSAVEYWAIFVEVDNNAIENQTKFISVLK